jgi:alpha-L-fucosidase
MKQIADYKIEAVSASAKQASEKGIKAFTDAAYGLSAHWGIYALRQSTEWTYFTDRVPFDEYKALMKKFNPTRFDANEWADLMIEANQKFLIITSKHHDGFCAWDTTLTDFKITNTPFKRDVLSELSTALRERGLSLHFYYSLVDWTHPGYRNDWSAYVSYYQNQIRELCTYFGEIGGIIFDGYWPRNEFEGDEIEFFAQKGPWDLEGTYNLIHDLQPNAVITNNTHVPPLPGEDCQVWELDLPGENRIGFNCTQIGDKPTASWWNLNNGWSYQPWRHAVKSAEEILKVYREARLRGAVFFLNVGPRPFGDIHPEEQQVLRTLGKTIRDLKL